MHNTASSIPSHGRRRRLLPANSSSAAGGCTTSAIGGSSTTCGGAPVGPPVAALIASSASLDVKKNAAAGHPAQRFWLGADQPLYSGGIRFFGTLMPFSRR